MQNRVFLVFFVAASIVFCPRFSYADDSLDPAQIKAALHTATEEEGGFIDRTVAMVNAGTLPRDLFLSTFIWARRKPKSKFQYFRRGLTLRAADQGITVK